MFCPAAQEGGRGVGGQWSVVVVRDWLELLSVQRSAVPLVVGIRPLYRQRPSPYCLLYRLFTTLDIEAALQPGWRGLALSALASRLFQL